MSKAFYRTEPEQPTADALAAALASGKGQVVRVTDERDGTVMMLVGVPLRAFEKPREMPETPVPAWVALLEDLRASPEPLHQEAAKLIEELIRHTAEVRKFDLLPVRQIATGELVERLEANGGDLSGRAIADIRRFAVALAQIAKARAEAQR